MPCSGVANPWDADPRRWCALRRLVEAEMVAQGWSRHAGKFTEVARRRARKAWVSGRALVVT